VKVADPAELGSRCGRGWWVVASHSVGSLVACDDGRVVRKVLIVDDHEEFRTSARAMLEAAGFQVVGEAANGAEAVAAVDRLRPAVVLLDIRLPDVDGFVVAHRLAGLAEPPQVVLVSSREAVAWGPKLGQSPVRGFIAKADLTGAALRRLLG
jgi:DNA-binding NarL/FixJ family response regulator